MLHFCVMLIACARCLAVNGGCVGAVGGLPFARPCGDAVRVGGGRGTAFSIIDVFVEL